MILRHMGACLNCQRCLSKLYLRPMRSKLSPFSYLICRSKENSVHLDRSISCGCQDCLTLAIVEYVIIIRNYSSRGFFGMKSSSQKKYIGTDKVE